MMPSLLSSGVIVHEEIVVGVGWRQRTSASNCEREPYPPSSAVGVPGTLVGSLGGSRQTAPAGALRSAARVGTTLAASAEPAANKTLRRPRWGNIPVLQLQSSAS